MVASEELYSAQNYLELVTGKCYCCNGDSDSKFIDKILEENGIDYLWDYPLSEIDEIIENNLKVVLVDCLELTENGEAKHRLRWHEVP